MSRDQKNEPRSGGGDRYMNSIMIGVIPQRNLSVLSIPTKLQELVVKEQWTAAAIPSDVYDFRMRSDAL